MTIDDSTRIVVTPKGEPKNFALQFLLPSGFVFEIPAIVPMPGGSEPDVPDALGIARPAPRPPC